MGGYQPVDASDLGDVHSSAAPTKGSVFAGDGSVWKELGVGTNNQVLTADSAQTLGVKWANATGGGGGGTAWEDLAASGNGPGGGDDDEFDDAAIAGAWTQQTVSGTATWTEDADVLSCKFSNQTSADAAAILKSMGGASAPVTIETAVRLFTTGTNYALVGLMFSDGTTTSSNIAIAELGIPVTNELGLRGGTMTAIGSQVASLNWATNGSGNVLPWLHMRMTWNSTNTFSVDVSPDGVSWVAVATSASVTLSPTHFGLYVTTFGGSDTKIASFEYFRVS